jgi:hypothetical protein
VALAAISLPILQEFVITGKLNLLKLQQILNWEAKVILIRKCWLLIGGQLYHSGVTGMMLTVDG